MKKTGLIYFVSLFLFVYQSFGQKPQLFKDEYEIANAAIKYVQGITPGTWHLVDKAPPLQITECLPSLFISLQTTQKDSLCIINQVNREKNYLWKNSPLLILPVLSADTIYNRKVRMKEAILHNRVNEFSQIKIERHISLSKPIFFRNRSWALIELFVGGGEILVYKKINQQWIFQKMICDYYE